MNGWRKAWLLGGMLAGLVAAPSGCVVAPPEDLPGEALDEGDELVLPTNESEQASADLEEPSSNGGPDIKESHIEVCPDPIPWHTAKPGSDRLERIAPDPIPWQPNGPSPLDPHDR